jgi:hypothetical protein
MRSSETIITDRVVLGSKRTARDRERLEALGVTHILNVTPTRESDPAAGVPCFHQSDASLTYRRVPLFDSKAENLLQYLPQCIAFINEARHYGSVLVHCLKGVSRSASIVIAYLMEQERLSLSEATKRVQGLRPQVRHVLSLYCSSSTRARSRNRARALVLIRPPSLARPLSLGVLACFPHR